MQVADELVKEFGQQREHDAAMGSPVSARVLSPNDCSHATFE
jgi:hypothetical protein